MVNLTPPLAGLLVLLLSSTTPTYASTPSTPPHVSTNTPQIPSIALTPPSPALAHTNLLIGNGGDTPNGSGGTIPSVAPPFGMTRWVAVTQRSYVSATPYNVSSVIFGKGGKDGKEGKDGKDGKEGKWKVVGVMGTRQPAIWMGESASVGVGAGVLVNSDGVEDKVKTEFEDRALDVVLREDGRREEVISVGYYSVLLDDAHGGRIRIEQAATSRVAHLRFTFSPSSSQSKSTTYSEEETPYLLFEVARPSIITSTPTNVTYPPGGVVLRKRSRSVLSSLDQDSESLALEDTTLEDTELCGYSTERQDAIITPTSSQPFAQHFRGWFCARFSVSSSVSSSSPSTTSPASSSSPSSPTGTVNAPGFEFQFGFIQNTTEHAAPKFDEEVTGPLLYAYLKLPQAQAQAKNESGEDEREGETVVTVRVGTSFISEDQARANIDAEVPDVSPTSPSPSPPPATASDSAPSTESAQSENGNPIDDSNDNKVPGVGTFEHTAYTTRKAWADLLGRISVDVYDSNSDSDAKEDGDGNKKRKNEDLEGRDKVDLEVFWTGVVRTVQFPSEQHEQGRYYSAYDNAVHSGESYTGYSIWDTYRAEWAWQILFVPERIPGLVRSMLNDYQEGGWLPMWKNIAETNIMVGTHADSLIAEAVLKGVSGLDTYDAQELAWEAVWKDATVPPVGDGWTVYDDREEGVDYEVRAGLSSVYDREDGGWVADDIHSESASRTLDYAYDDYAAYGLAHALGKPANITEFLRARAMRAPFTIFNKETGFMEARNADGSWAGEDRGWTEGDKWAYSFDVVHDVLGLIEARGGALQFVKSLDEHFDGGHNDHTNEPSHHIPYLYAMAGASYKTQEKVREIAVANYNNTPTGLSGNEDCGQMSAWYIFSALGFYPVNPVSGQYVVGSPFFEKVTLTLHPPESSPVTLTIRAPGARTKPYIKSLTVNGVPVVSPTISHEQIAHGGEVVFEMSDKVERWGNTDEVLLAFGAVVDQAEDALRGQEGVKSEEEKTGTSTRPTKKTHGARRDEL